jgi:hypothetical protein
MGLSPGDPMRILVITAATTMLVASVPSIAQSDASGQVQFDPDQMSFRSVVIDRCKSRKIEATNNANLAIPDAKYRMEGSRAFSIAKRFKRCPDPLGPGQGCRLYIAFCPASAGIHEGSVVFSSGIYERKIPITGRARQAGK